MAIQMFRLFLTEKKIVTPFTLAILIGWIFFGITIASAAFTSWQPDPSLATTDPFVEFAVGAFIAVGSASVIYSTRDRQDITRQWFYDKLGMQLCIGGWAAYASCVLIADPTRLVPLIFAITFLIACLVRWIVVHIYDRRITRKVAKRQEEQWNG